MGIRLQVFAKRLWSSVADAHPDAALYTAEELLRHHLMAET